MPPADPYRNFQFRLRLGRDPAGRIVAGFNRASGLPSPFHYARPPGVGPATALRFEHGLTCDADFARWCTAAAPDPRDLIIELLDPTGHIAQAFLATGCWATQCVALPDLDRNVNAIAIESLSAQAASATSLPR